MTQPQVTSGTATAQWRGSPTVKLVTANGAPIDRRRVPTAPNRASGWIVQIVIVATSAFAVLDLYLLAAGVHH